MKFSYVPAYGFGKAKKNELNKTDQLITPGPGKYYPIKIIHKNPEWKIGTSQRPKESNIDNPGPGTYETRFKFPDGPSYSIRTRKSEVIDEDQITPGPSSYEPKIFDKKSSYTFGHKYKNKESEITPGPGKYEIRKEKDLKVPSSIFGREKKFFSSKEADLVPGPGQYNGNIATTNIQSRSTEHLPGPGQYVTYNYNIVSRKLPDIKIGKAKRFLLDNSLVENPGPGQYDISDGIKYTKLQKPSWKIGTSIRRPLNEAIETPGPGNYNLTGKIGEGKPQYSMRIKDKEKGDRYVTPGPGRYNNSEMNLYKHYPEWKIGTSQRDDALQRQIKEGFPGPGNYHSNDKNLTSKPKYGFGTQKRYKDKYNDNPGPGSYHIPCSIIEVNDYTRKQGNFDETYKNI